jgi:hypothetical protein
LISLYKQVVFIDSHTEEIIEKINYQTIEPEYKNSPFTHHFSPSSCLALTLALKEKCPKAWLLSIRGYNFGFTTKLSEPTQKLVVQAKEIIYREFLKLYDNS